MSVLTRRSLLAAAAAVMATPSVAACAPRDEAFDSFRIGGRSAFDRGFKVHSFTPASAGAHAEILFVMHGRNRDPENYLRAWAPVAAAGGLILLAPEYDENRFEGAREYNLGGVQDERGEWRPRSQWSFNHIESAFDGFLA